MGLHYIQNRKFKATTNSAHDLPVAQNLFDQKFEVDGPGKVYGNGNHRVFHRLSHDQGTCPRCLGEGPPLPTTRTGVYPSFRLWESVLCP